MALLNELQGTRTIARLLVLLRLAPFVDALDTLVARQRGRLSRYVPDGSDLHRYP